MLKTEWRNKESLVKICDEFFNKFNVIVNHQEEIFTISLSILPLINPWNDKLSYLILDYIFKDTGCRIFYPPKEKYTSQPPSYFIKVCNHFKP